ncbi:hypothetical protein ACIQ1D_18910 [Lysinibacillus xylanilyticus]|uniref:hypothetical protein n=1 Tax=Lysinibacillus xylanilyticus TaxID=582475 RepID=UPI003810FA9A
MKSDKELFEFQNLVIKKFKEAERVSREQFELPKGVSKHFDTIGSYLHTYELMFDTLTQILEVTAKVVKSNELETIEREMKVLNDTFWN